MVAVQAILRQQQAMIAVRALAAVQAMVQQLQPIAQRVQQRSLMAHVWKAARAACLLMQAHLLSFTQVMPARAQTQALVQVQAMATHLMGLMAQLIICQFANNSLLNFKSPRDLVVAGFFYGLLPKRGGVCLRPS